MVSAKKTQAAIEFVILFTLMFAIFSGFLYFYREQFSRIQQTQVQEDADRIAQDITRYVLFARGAEVKVKDFTLPLDLGGEEYTAELALDVEETYLILTLVETDRTFFYPLGKKVQGFMNKEIPDHCITTKDDKVHIASSGIVLQGEDGSVGSMQTTPGTFSVFVLGTCLHDFVYLRAALSFDTNALTLVSSSQSYGDIFFNPDAEVDYSITPDFEIELRHLNPLIGPIGSDKLIELVFSTQRSGKTSIVITPIELSDRLIRAEPPVDNALEVDVS